jgi:hypothetical protein
MVIKKCDVCGTEFETIIWNAKRCSDECKKIGEKEQQKKWKEKNPEYHKKWNEENPERKKEHSKKWREKNRDHRKEYDKKYYKENCERVKERNKKWKEKNPEHIKEYHKKWNEENPERIKEYKKKYLQNLFDQFVSNGYSFDSPQELKNALITWGYDQRYNENVEGMVAHHIYPKSSYIQFALDEWNCALLSDEMHDKFHSFTGSTMKASLPLAFYKDEWMDWSICLSDFLYENLNKEDE